MSAVPQIARCGSCGSRDVFYDAWVGINDPADVRTFDAIFCPNCEGAVSVVWTADTDDEEVDA